jgi:indole-3-glycerol phosphate synthase
MNVLQQILDDKRAEIAERRKTERLPDRPSAGPSFAAALRSAPMALIAEVKRRSPSAGMIRDPFDPVAIARAYERAGAQAISVLMDRKYFGGGEDDFKAVRAAVHLPLLYKEFIVDEWQLRHAASLGASAVLLIAGALSDAELKAFISRGRALNLAALVEAHDETETARAVSAEADCVGVNNRDLRTFNVAIETSLRLRPLVPASVLFVAESGIKTSADVARLKQAGANAVLVGESLLRQPDLEQAVRGLMGGGDGRFS